MPVGTASAKVANTAGECTSPTRKSRTSAYLTTLKNRGARNGQVSEVAPMIAEQLLSLHRRVERGWAGCMTSLRQIRDQVAVATRMPAIDVRARWLANPDPRKGGRWRGAALSAPVT